jgi:muramoyltetrapeptide carboxypeptidase
MINQPKPLKRGDTIAITCPAKKLPKDITQAVQLLESWGLKVILGDTVSASYHQFAGTDEFRAKDLQRFLDDDNVHAIIAARGGYGTIRIIDKLDFTRFNQNPKWLVGFSDISVLHSHIYSNFGIETIHGQMPMTIPDSTGPGIETLRKALFGEELSYSYTSDFANKPGRAEGTLVGGNLTLVLYMNGSVSEIDLNGKILFIEDVGEYLYSIDRMMWNLKRSGKLAGLKGLIVGGFTE